MMILDATVQAGDIGTVPNDVHIRVPCDALRNRVVACERSILRAELVDPLTRGK